MTKSETKKIFSIDYRFVARAFSANDLYDDKLIEFFLKSYEQIINNKNLATVLMSSFQYPHLIPNIIFFYTVKIFMFYKSQENTDYELDFVRFTSSDKFIKELPESVTQISELIFKFISIYQYHDKRPLTQQDDIYFHMINYYTDRIFRMRFPEVRPGIDKVINEEYDKLNRLKNTKKDIMDIIDITKKNVSESIKNSGDRLGLFLPQGSDDDLDVEFSFLAAFVEDELKKKQPVHCDLGHNLYRFLEHFIENDLTEDQADAFVNYQLLKNPHSDFNKVHKKKTINAVIRYHAEALYKLYKKIQYEGSLYNPFLSPELKSSYKEKILSYIKRDEIVDAKFISFLETKEMLSLTINIASELSRCISFKRFNKGSAHQDHIILNLYLFYIFEIEPGEISLPFFTESSVKEAHRIWIEYVTWRLIRKGRELYSDQARYNIFTSMINHYEKNKTKQEKKEYNEGDKEKQNVNRQIFLIYMKNVYDVKARRSINESEVYMHTGLTESEKGFYAEIKSLNQERPTEIDLTDMEMKYQSKLIHHISYCLARKLSVKLLYFLSSEFFVDEKFINTEIKDQGESKVTDNDINNFFYELKLKNLSAVKKDELNQYLKYISQYIEVK